MLGRAGSGRTGRRPSRGRTRRGQAPIAQRAASAWRLRIAPKPGARRRRRRLSGICPLRTSVGRGRPVVGRRAFGSVGRTPPGSAADQLCDRHRPSDRHRVDGRLPGGFRSCGDGGTAVLLTKHPVSAIRSGGLCADAGGAVEEPHVRRILGAPGEKIQLVLLERRERHSGFDSHEHTFAISRCARSRAGDVARREDVA